MARLVVFGKPGDPRKWVTYANQISARIADGRYPRGKWLPPMAKISADLGSTSATRGDYETIQRALNEIAAHGLVTFVEQTGYYTGDEEPEEKPEGPFVRYRTAGTAGPRGHRADRPGPRAESLVDEEYITALEFATMLRVSKMTAYRIIHSNQIHGVIRIGRSFRIPVSGATSYLAACHLEETAEVS